MSLADSEMANDTPYPICGDKEYIWGTVKTFNTAVGFEPDDNGFFGSILEAKGRRCARCGNLQIFTAKP